MRGPKPFATASIYAQAEKRLKVLWEMGHLAWSNSVEMQFQKGELEITDVQLAIREGQVFLKRRGVQCTRYSLRGPAVDTGRIMCEIEVKDDDMILVKVWQR